MSAFTYAEQLQGSAAPMNVDVVRFHNPPASPGAVENLLRSARVVIVDDQLTNTELLRSMMQAGGISNISTLTDPRTAVRECLDFGADLVLLDWHMPGMDGADVLSALRSATPVDHFLPVIVLTSDDSTAVRNQALAAGANDFLTRPFDLSEVTLRVRNLLQTRALHNDVQRHSAALQADLDRRAEDDRRLASERRVMEERVEGVLASDALTIVCQPIANLSTGQILGFEALARFATDPQRSPDQWFIEARDVGLDEQLELAAVHLALEQLKALPDGCFMSINVSPDTATADGFAAAIAEVPGDRIVVELTEHSPIDDYERLLPALDSLRDRGLRIAVDDAGAGYSGLRHVLRLRPEILKLDMALTQGIEADPARRALATALVTFAAEIRATIVAEGIETTAQLDTLRQLGVQLGQGYHLGRPSPAHDWPVANLNLSRHR